MMLRFMICVLALAAFGGLTACSGGGDGIVSERPPESDIPPSGPGATQNGGSGILLSDPSATQGEASELSRNLPAFGSVTQSSNVGHTPSITSDKATAQLISGNVLVKITSGNGKTISLDTLSDSIYEESIEVGGYTESADVVLVQESDGVTLGAVYGYWKTGSAEDFISGGYWVHAESNDEGSNISDLEVGAFIDGPELSSTGLNLPTERTATYRGEGAGLYIYDGSSANIPSEAGEFGADVNLTANFNSSTISGCIGCEYVNITYVTEDGEIGYENSPLQVKVGASINSDGTFRSYDVILEEKGWGALPGASGAWGGQFSNVLKEDIPRLVAGTIGTAWEDEDGGEGSFVGFWAAE